MIDIYGRSYVKVKMWVCKPGAPANIRMLGEAGLTCSHSSRKGRPCLVLRSQLPSIPNHEAIHETSAVTSVRCALVLWLWEMETLTVSRAGPLLGTQGESGAFTT